MTKAVAAKRETTPFVVILLVLLVIGSLTVFLLPRAVEALILGRIAKATGLEATVGEFQIGLARSEFSLKDLFLLNPPDFPSAPLAVVSEAKVQFLPPPVLGISLDVKRVEVNFSEFRLIRNEKGVLNLPASQVPEKVRDPFDEVLLNLNTVTYTDLSGGQPVQTTFNIALQNGLYRNVKGIGGIVEIVNWEVLKRTGIEEKVSAAPAPPPGPPSVPILEPSPVPAEPAPAPEAAESPAPAVAETQD